MTSRHVRKWDLLHEDLDVQNRERDEEILFVRGIMGILSYLGLGNWMPPTPFRTLVRENGQHGGNAKDRGRGSIKKTFNFHIQFSPHSVIHSGEIH